MLNVSIISGGFVNTKHLWSLPGTFPVCIPKQILLNDGDKFTVG